MSLFWKLVTGNFKLSFLVTGNWKLFPLETDTKGVDNTIMEQQERDLNKPIRFVILGTSYTIKPTEDLTAEAINELIDYVKGLVESYLRKGFDKPRIPLLVAFHIADEKRRLQEEYELPLHRIVERLQFAIEEDTETHTQPATRNAEEAPDTEEE